jgi:prepilin-type N-terminal cleavage/methylation domain-containing protein
LPEREDREEGDVVKRRSAGFTLIEVVIAMLLVLLAVTAVMTALTSSHESVGHSQRRVAAAQAARSLLEKLRSFNAPDFVSGQGPGVGVNSWGLPHDQCNCPAFKPGTHVLNPAYYAPDLVVVGGTISYTVTKLDTPLGAQPTVTVNVNWTEPH